MAYYNQGVFTPKNKEKYIGKFPIEFRSAWELTFMNVCDNHPNILEWSSESLTIPYIHPLDGRKHNYIPDFFVVFQDKDGNLNAEVIEIKPMNQTVMELAKTRKMKEIVLVNHAKWQAAIQWCHDRGFKFRIMTAEQLYRGPVKKR